MTASFLYRPLPLSLCPLQLCIGQKMPVKIQAQIYKNPSIMGQSSNSRRAPHMLRHSPGFEFEPFLLQGDKNHFLVERDSGNSVTRNRNDATVADLKTTTTILTTATTTCLFPENNFEDLKISIPGQNRKKNQRMDSEGSSRRSSACSSTSGFEGIDNCGLEDEQVKTFPEIL